MSDVISRSSKESRIRNYVRIWSCTYDTWPTPVAISALKARQRNKVSEAAQEADRHCIFLDKPRHRFSNFELAWDVEQESFWMTFFEESFHWAMLHKGLHLFLVHFVIFLPLRMERKHHQFSHLFSMRGCGGIFLSIKNSHPQVNSVVTHRDAF